MNPLNPLFALIIFLIAYLTAYLLNLKYKISNESSRYETIDGMRGFLALCVFMCHSSIWFQYIQTKNWAVPKSNLYTHFGETSVAFFFMITSFLFISKLLNTNDKVFNWKAFFISRFFRLTPMYLVSIFILIFFVMAASNWELHLSVFKFLNSVIKWLTFTIVDNPNINNFEITSMVNAGVIWSLPFEWLFYFSLPLIALLILKTKPSPFYILIGIAFVLYYLKVHHGVKIHHILSFLGGAIAPFILKYAPKKINADTILASCIVLVCLFLIGEFSTAENVLCKVLITIIFTIVALGNTLFGLLKNPTLKFMGDICYSTYLMHGIILFAVFYFGIGTEKASQFSPLQYCLFIFLITPLVIMISFLGFRFIEKPFMDRAKNINSKSAVKAK